MNLEYPGWQEPLVAALVELHVQKRVETLRSAAEQIARRMHELASEDASLELRLLQDGLALLRELIRMHDSATAEQKISVDFATGI